LHLGEARLDCSSKVGATLTQSPYTSAILYTYLKNPTNTSLRKAQASLQKLKSVAKDLIKPLDNSKRTTLTRGQMHKSFTIHQKKQILTEAPQDLTIPTMLSHHSRVTKRYILGVNNLPSKTVKINAAQNSDSIISNEIHTSLKCSKNLLLICETLNVRPIIATPEG